LIQINRLPMVDHGVRRTMGLLQVPDATVLRTFTIVTTNANERVGEPLDRMPVKRTWRTPRSPATLTVLLLIMAGSQSRPSGSIRLPANFTVDLHQLAHLPHVVIGIETVRVLIRWRTLAGLIWDEYGVGGCGQEKARSEIGAPLGKGGNPSCLHLILPIRKPILLLVVNQRNWKEVMLNPAKVQAVRVLPWRDPVATRRGGRSHRITL
jgi:hypothetical protein